MHILITGAAGMIGRKLTERLAGEGGLNGRQIERLTLLDVVLRSLLRTPFSSNSKRTVDDRISPPENSGPMNGIKLSG